MHDLTHRLALSLLFALGGALLLSAMAGGADGSVAGQHRQAMVALMGLTLLASPWQPALRIPAVGTAILGKLAYLSVAWSAAGALEEPAGLWGEAAQLLALLAAGAILLREARLEARWDMALRPEA